MVDPLLPSPAAVVGPVNPAIESIIGAGLQLRSRVKPDVDRQEIKRCNSRLPSRAEAQRNSRAGSRKGVLENGSAQTTMQQSSKPQRPPTAAFGSDGYQ